MAIENDLEDDEIVAPEDRGDDIEEDEELEDQDDSADDEELEDDDELDSSDEEEDIEETLEEDPPSKIKIPKSRFDEVIRQREEARDRNAWLEDQLEKLINASLSKTEKNEVVEPTLPSYDFDEAEQKYISAVLEGEVGQATRLRKEIDAARAAEYKQMISTLTKNVTDQAKSESTAVIEAQKFSALIENYENKHKFLDRSSKSYNEEAVDTVNTLLAGYVASGKSKVEGLKLAVEKVAPLYSSPVDTKPTLGNKRKVEAGKKAVVASKSQPAKTKSSSTRQTDADSVDVKRMSERDFSKLTSKEKSILRGDSF